MLLQWDSWIVAIEERWGNASVNDGIQGDPSVSPNFRKYDR